jgi:hypothetical protein
VKQKSDIEKLTKETTHKVTILKADTPIVSLKEGERRNAKRDVRK